MLPMLSLLLALAGADPNLPNQFRGAATGCIIGATTGALIGTAPVITLWGRVVTPYTSRKGILMGCAVGAVTGNVIAATSDAIGWMGRHL